MADAVQIPDEVEVRARWGGFHWTPENARRAQEILARFPKGREQSASLALLDLAQRVALLVEQERGDRDRHLGADFGGAILEGLFFDQAQDRQ